MPAPSIKEDVIHGQSVRITKSGTQRVRIYIAKDLPHGAGVDPLYEAYQLLQDAEVDYGTAHPSIANLHVTDIFGETFNNTPTQAKFTVTYGPPEYGGPLSGEKIITVSGSSHRRMVRYDKNGELIKPTYNGKSVIGEVETLVSHTVLEFEFEDANPPPRGLANSVNSATWQGGSPGTWMSRDPVARMIIARTLWHKKYSFEFDEEGWEKASIYRDPFTQTIPADVDPVTPGVDSGNGWVRPTTHDELDFNAFGLPVVYT